MHNNILPHLEWEVLREPIKITKANESIELPPGQKKIEINRDEQYNLKAILSYRGDFRFFDKRAKSTPGDFIEPFTIEGSDQHGLENYLLESCYFGSVHAEYHPQQNEKNDKEIPCKADLFLHGLKVTYDQKIEGSWLTEWYINGPHSHIFSNSTLREMSKTFFRERSISENDKTYAFEVSGGCSHNSYRDFLRIKTDDNEFLVAKVPEEIGPKWSSNIGIEYRLEWGRIPDTEERKKIGELCSFIFGRQLLSVGYSIYNNNTQLIEEYACNPWTKYSKSLCLESDNPPIRIDYSSSGTDAGHLISKLLATYYEMRESFNLKDALWLYWIASNMPIGTNLPLFSSAVEAIMKGWFSSTKTKSHGIYLEQTEFETLIQDEMIVIEKKLKDKKYGDKVIKNLKGANRMSSGDKFKFFFDEIDLVVDENELKAIEARHKIAHGRIGNGIEEDQDLIKYKHAYETLIHKILLKLLGYSGPYIDRSNNGWVDKQLI